MNYRKDVLVNDEYYHIFTRSIAKYIIFNDAEDYSRLCELLEYYQFTKFYYKYSNFKKLKPELQKSIIDNLRNDGNRMVKIVAYCIMPTHVHLILKQIEDDGITKFMSKVLNSYTKYFNTRHHRKGPLWEGHFKNVIVKTDEQLLHLTRYIHLNPSSAGLVENPFDWDNSSLKEYVNERDNHICKFKNIMDLTSSQYKKFTLDNKNYQKSLAIIKSQIIDNYSG